MNRQTGEPVVLARLPDLGDVGRDRRGGKTPESRGRLIGQALSFKLLAVCVLLLIAIALIPWSLRKHSSSAESSPAAVGSAAPVSQPSASAPVAASPPSAPAATPQPQPKVATAPPPPPPAEIPRMSKWPSPDHPTSAAMATGVEPHADVNQPMALRPPEYLRSNHDRTGSGVH